MNQVLFDGKAPNFASVSGPSVPVERSGGGGKNGINNTAQQHHRQPRLKPQRTLPVDVLKGHAAVLGKEDA